MGVRVHMLDARSCVLVGSCGLAEWVFVVFSGLVALTLFLNRLGLYFKLVFNIFCLR